MAKNQQKNGVNVLPDQLEQMRMEVVERELRARFAKANWEIMHYSMENEKLQPEYTEYVKREKAKQEAAQKQYEEFLASITNKSEEGKLGVTAESTEEVDSTTANAPTDAEGAESADEVDYGVHSGGYQGGV